MENVAFIKIIKVVKTFQKKIQIFLFLWPKKGVSMIYESLRLFSNKTKQIEKLKIANCYKRKKYHCHRMIIYVK